MAVSDEIDGKEFSVPRGDDHDHRRTQDKIR